MSHNRFGRAFTVTTWGESHGPAIGCVIDGCPASVPLSVDDIQPFLERRRTGKSRHTSQRREADEVAILSGVYQGRTLGTPIHLMITNSDARSKDYQSISETFRPGHADLTYLMKYGVRDPRGGGRASARETAMRVAAGAVARKVMIHRLGYEPRIRAAVCQVGEKKCDREAWNWDEVENNPFFCPDQSCVPVWENLLDELRRSGDSCGAVLELHCDGIPGGWGEPIYGKMDADLAAAMMGINAAKAVEIGDGFALAAMRGSKIVDSPLASKDLVSSWPEQPQPHDWQELGQKRHLQFSNNHAGGIWGGITTGQTIILRVAFKPTSSIRTPVPTIQTNLEKHQVSTQGRHDPCVGLRAVPIVEAMAFLTLTDHMLRHRAQCAP